MSNISKKTFYIKTLGCKVNQYESEVIREQFLKNGFREVDSMEKAKVVTINTCTVTSKSDSKSLKFINSAASKPGKCVIATGCLVEGREFDLDSVKGVRFIIRNIDKYRIPEIVGGKKPVDKDYSVKELGKHTRSFVKIQDGCDNVCSYCKVRIVRGPSVSRPMDDILKECANIIKNGSKEIVLTGICLGAYGRDISKEASLAGLIKELSKIKGEWRLRLSSIEPKDVSGALINELKMNKKLCKHLHMPFQSGDDSVLKKMHRPYKAAAYLKIVDDVRKEIPDIAISTDIMVGFPGETEGNFNNTIDFLNKIRPMRMHVFPFSPRIGTEAYIFKDTVNEAVKRKREDILLGMAKAFAKEFEKRFLGRYVEVLIEDKHSVKGLLEGYTDNYIRVFIDSPDKIKGSLIKFKLDFPVSRY